MAFCGHGMSERRKYGVTYDDQGREICNECGLVVFESLPPVARATRSAALAASSAEGGPGTQGESSLDREARGAVNGVKALGRAVVVIAVVCGVLGVLLGLVLCFATGGLSIDANGSLTSGESHPYVAAGIAVAVGSLVQAVFIALVGRYAQMRALMAERELA